VFAVCGALIALGGLAARPACEPGSARLFDLTPALPYFFTALAVVGAVVMFLFRGRFRMVVGVLGLVTTCSWVAITIAIVVGDFRAGSHCWSF
jgi:hypothetical protein